MKYPLRGYIFLVFWGVFLFDIRRNAHPFTENRASIFEKLRNYICLELYSYCHWSSALDYFSKNNRASPYVISHEIPDPFLFVTRDYVYYCGWCHCSLSRRGLPDSWYVHGSTFSFFLFSIIFSCKKVCTGFKYAHCSQFKSLRSSNRSFRISNNYRKVSGAGVKGFSIYGFWWTHRCLYCKSKSVPVNQASRRFPLNCCDAS